MNEKNTKRNGIRKRYGWLVIFAVLNWITISLIVWRVDPESMRNFIFPESYLPMVILVFIGIFLLLSILFLSASKAFRWTVGISLFLLLRIWKLGTLINGLLILGILISWEVYVYKSKSSKREFGGTKDSGIASPPKADRNDDQV